MTNKSTPPDNTKTARHKLQQLVPHPRYGDKVIVSGSTADADEIRQSFWRYPHETIFPQSAIKADVKLQHYGAHRRGYYVDILKHCRSCSRPYLFFAKEQRHWYETLGFWIDADCVHCPECRKSDQQVRRRFQRYGAAINREKLPVKELVTLVSDAIFLWQAGLLRDEQKLYRLRKTMRRILADHKVTLELECLIASLPPADNPPT